MELTNAEKVLELTRVRTAGGLPIVIFQSYINPKMVQITKEEINNCESLYSFSHQRIELM
ncbi:UTRA domain-containing protein [Lactococcus muris]|uniref:UTRA domain-containing protein n=1 Tax=Lactococcus muris TaxID=2941330 RepID=UPI00373FD979